MPLLLLNVLGSSFRWTLIHNAPLWKGTWTGSVLSSRQPCPSLDSFFATSKTSSPWIYWQLVPTVKKRRWIFVRPMMSASSGCGFSRKSCRHTKCELFVHSTQGSRRLRQPRGNYTISPSITEGCTDVRALTRALTTTTTCGCSTLGPMSRPFLVQ